MGFNDYREPIEYVVDRYFERKRFINANTGVNDIFISSGGMPPDMSLPETPCYLVRGEDGKVTKVIYGDYELLETEEECDPVVWQEELLREDGKVVGVLITYPDGEMVKNVFERNEKDKLEKVKIEA